MPEAPKTVPVELPVHVWMGNSEIQIGTITVDVPVVTGHIDSEGVLTVDAGEAD